MGNRFDDVIAAYAQDPSDTKLLGLHVAFLTANFHVPVSEPVKELDPNRYDIPVICVKTETGAGAIPAFTTMDHLFKWKPEGCLYTSLTGSSLLAMAADMEAISEIRVNPNDVPCGRIPRADFRRMLALKFKGMSGEA